MLHTQLTYIYTRMRWRDSKHTHNNPEAVDVRFLGVVDFTVVPLKSYDFWCLCVR